MKVVVTGGGSGGHITPILAVAHKLKQTDPAVDITFIGQKGDDLADIVERSTYIDQVYAVQAGKLRRYSGEGLRQLLDFKTQFLNVRDVFRVLVGIWQSYRTLKKIRPDVIFTRGGFVSVPVAVAGRLRGIPYITHDSDSVPSLANRLIAGGARLHAVAMPVELYPYPAAKTVLTGIPLSREFVPVDTTVQQKYREDLGIDVAAPVLFVTGGGNGAQRLNHLIVGSTKHLIGIFPTLNILHITGRKHLEETVAAYDALDLGAARRQVIVRDFVSDIFRYSGAADLIVNRGTATNLAEFAVQGKACLAIPAPGLGWNVHNVAALADRGAVAAVSEAELSDVSRLGEIIAGLLSDPRQRTELARNLSELSEPNAAEKLAEIILRIGAGTYARPS